MCAPQVDAHEAGKGAIATVGVSYIWGPRDPPLA